MRLGVGAAYVDGRFVPGDVEVADGLIRAVGLGAPNSPRLALPGFVDLQVNGAGSVDLLDAQADLDELARCLAAGGVTAFRPTLVTADPATVHDALERLEAGECALRMLGVHLEGPFISPVRLGAHDPEQRRDPDPALMERYLAAGRVEAVTLAPELPGAMALVDLLVARGVTVALGHSDADAEVAHAAFDRGASMVTHLFNAMSFGGHRAPGLGMVALARDDVAVTVILDAHHLSDEAATLAWRAAQGRLALVTDRVATSAGGGSLGGRRLDLVDSVPTKETGSIAGSSTEMAPCVRRLCDLGADLERAVAAASEIPARIAGRPELGRLTVGGPADVVVVDDGLEVHSTLVGGTNLL